jgi:DNA-binding PadR family transcriptional regulator
MMDPHHSHLEYALLGLLADHPAHGYELHKKLHDLPALGQIWFVKQANLYAMLDRLEARGLIASRQVEAGGYPPRKEYALTRAGEEALQSWLRAPVARPREMRQEFLLRLYFARQSGPQEARDLLASQRQALQHWQAEIRKMIADLPDEENFQALVLEYRLRQLQATFDWLDWCESQPFLQG